MGIGRSKRKTAGTITSSLGDEFGADPSASPPTTRETEVAGSMVGRYKLLQRIGEGGFGVVYMAEQREPIVRRVALKIIKAGMDTKQVITRFEAERQALALMDHPNIAKVLDGGATENGRPYFVMELVRGLPITLFCDREKFDTRQRLELFMDVCAAVQHAHQKGIIHRDLKPSNILVGIADGKPVAKVIDFGIAKATQQQLTDKTLFTQFGQFIGTPLYISPEQAEISAIDVDTRSDIYSLGVILYELLTGRPPLDSKKLLAAGLDEMRRMIRETEALKPSTCFGTIDDEELACIAAARHTEPRKLGHFIKGDLDWIVLKALEKERARRYGTANAFREDLRRFLVDEPVSAAAPGSLYKFRKFARRNKGALAAVSGVVLALLGGAIVSKWQANEARHARDGEAMARKAADLKAREADEARAGAQRRLEISARADWVMGKNYITGGLGARGDAFAYLARSCENDPSATLATETSVFVMNAFANENGLSLPLERFEDHVASIDFSPDGSRIVAGRVIFDSTTGKPLITLRGSAIPKSWQLKDEVMESRFSRDGTRIVTSTASGHGFVWDSQTGELLAMMLEPAPSQTEVALKPRIRGRTLPGQRMWATHRAEFDTSGERILTSGQTRWATPSQGYVEWPGAARVREAGTGRILFTLEGHTDGINYARYSPDGTRIITASQDETVRVWNAASGASLIALEGHSGGALYAEISPNGKNALTVAADHKVRLWSLATGELLHTHEEHKDRVTTAHFSPDGNFLLTASADRRLLLLRIEALLSNRPAEIIKHQLDCEITEAAFSPDGRYCTIAGSDGRIWIVNVRHRQISQAASVSASSPVRFSPDGMRIAALTMGAAQRAFGGRIPQSGILHTLHSRVMRSSLEGSLTSPVWSPDGTRLYGIALKGREIWTIDPKSTSIIHSLRREYGIFDDLVLGPGTSRPLSVEVRAGLTNRAVIRDVSTGTTLVTLQIGGESPEHIAYGRFSPDGSRLATVSGNPARLRVWDTGDGRLITAIREEVNSMMPPTFSPDGDYVACGLRDKQWGVWATENGTMVAKDPSWFQSFAPAGDRFVTTKGSTAMIWNSRSGEKLVTVDHAGMTALSAASAEAAGDSGEETDRCDVIRAGFSPDGLRLVTSSEDHSARIWKVQNGEELGNLSEHNGTVFDAVFSPDGQRLVTRSRFNTTESVESASSIWDTVHGQRLVSYSGGGTVSFSPDGDQIAVFGGNNLQLMETMGRMDRVPPWWPRFLEIFGGARLKDSGEIALLTPIERQELANSVQAALKTDDSRLGAMARWILCPPGDRTVSPWDTRTPREFAEKLITPAALPANLQRAYDLDPANPLVILALSSYPELSPWISSGNEASLQREFLRARGLMRLGDDPDLNRRAASLLAGDVLGTNPAFSQFFPFAEAPNTDPAKQIEQFLILLLSSDDVTQRTTGTRFLITLLNDDNRLPDWPDFFGFEANDPGKNALALGALLLACDDRQEYIALCQRYATFMDRSKHKHIHRFVRLCMLPRFAIPPDLREHARELGARMVAENPDFGFGWGQLAVALSCYRNDEFEEAVQHTNEVTKSDETGLKIDQSAVCLADTIKTLSLYKLGRMEATGARLALIRKKLDVWKKKNPSSDIFHVAYSVEYLLGEARDLGIDWEQTSE